MMLASITQSEKIKNLQITAQQITLFPEREQVL
jgi:hypothetical protein